MKNKFYQYLLFSIITIFMIGCQSYKTVTEKTTVSSKVEKEPYVLLISFDGFRHDYTEKYDLPNFKRMMKEGTYATSMLPSFPSKTFPNHYSIITGMYPGNHGLVDNKYYDKKRKTYYSLADRDKVEDPYYYGGTPLWQHLQNNGMKTASYYWVGSETPIMGQFPTYYHKYDGDTPNETRIHEVMNWFRLPKSERPRFVTLYFSLVDHEGHETGPNSPELKKTVQEADRLMGMILDSVQKVNLPITTIVTSDHGMTEMSSKPENLIFLDAMLAPIKDKIVYVNSGMHCHIYINEGEDKNQIYDFLKNALSTTPIKVYKKEETPKHWHYNQNYRIGDILLTVDAPLYMLPDANHPVTKKDKPWGTHGYDPYTTPDMGAIFYIVGDNVKKNNKIGEFENINIFPLINKILGVPNPENIDGNINVLENVLIKK